MIAHGAAENRVTFRPCAHSRSQGLNSGQYHREVLGLTPSHDGVDSNLLDRGLAVAGAERADEFVPGATRRAGQHTLDPLAGRRHDRETIGDATLVELLDRVISKDTVRCRARCGAPRS